MIALLCARGGRDPAGHLARLRLRRRGRHRGARGDHPAARRCSSLVGRRIESVRLPAFMRPKPKEPGTGLWARWGARRHPPPAGRDRGVAGRCSASSLIPVFSLELGQEDIGATPKDTTERQAYDLMTAGFGVGYNGPLLIAVNLDSPATADPAVQGAGGPGQRPAGRARAGAEGGPGAAGRARAAGRRAEGPAGAARGASRRASSAQAGRRSQRQAAALERQADAGAGRAARPTEREIALRSRRSRGGRSGDLLGGRARWPCGAAVRAAARPRRRSRRGWPRSRPSIAAIERLPGRRRARGPAGAGAAAERGWPSLQAAGGGAARRLAAARAQERVAARPGRRAAQAGRRPAPQPADDAPRPGAPARRRTPRASRPRRPPLERPEAGARRRRPLRLQAPGRLAPGAGRRPPGAAGRSSRQLQATAAQQQKQAEELKKQLTEELTKAGGDDRGTDPRLVKLQDALAGRGGRGPDLAAADQQARQRGGLLRDRHHRAGRPGDRRPGQGPCATPVIPHGDRGRGHPGLRRRLDGEQRRPGRRDLVAAAPGDRGRAGAQLPGAAARLPLAARAAAGRGRRTCSAWPPPSA